VVAESNASPQRFLAVGKIVSVHGVRGEVKLDIMTDFPERFAPGAEFWLGPEDDARLVKLASVRPHQDALLIRLESVTDRTVAETLRDRLLLIPETDAMPLGENENYAHDLLGLKVITGDGAILGTITDILRTGANDVYVVTGDAGEILLPALREVVLKVDLAEHAMTVAVPEGL
jgi:16S rRNA processing protein RimM